MENSDDERPKQKTDLPESTRRIMERMLKTPPKPHDKAVKGKPEVKPKRPSPSKQDR